MLGPRDKVENFVHSQASERDREFLSFNLAIRDEIENFQ